MKRFVSFLSVLGFVCLLGWILLPVTGADAESPLDHGDGYSVIIGETDCIPGEQYIMFEMNLEGEFSSLEECELRSIVELTADEDGCIQSAIIGTNNVDRKFMICGVFKDGSTPRIFETVRNNGVQLPEGTVTVGAEAFRGSSIQIVVMSDNVQEIGEYAFAECGRLKYVEIPSTVTSIADNAFSGTDTIIACGHDSYASEYAQGHGLTIVWVD